MKCPICNKGKMEKVNDKIEKDGVEFEAYRCSSCGEEIMDMNQLKVLAAKYRKLRKNKKIDYDLVKQFKDGLEDVKSGKIKRVA